MIRFAAPCASDSALAITGRDYVSWSQIETYRQCPLKFYFRYVRRLPEEEVSSSLVFGGAFHAAAEHHFNEVMAGNPAPGLETLLEVFWDAWRDRNEEAVVRLGRGESVLTIAELAERMLAAFQQSEVAQPGSRILGVEEELRGLVAPGVPELLARLDLVTETDDAVVVTDLKTARSRWSLVHANASAEQLLLYSELAKRLVPGKPVRLRFAVVSKRKTPTVDLHEIRATRFRIEQVKRTVEIVWRAIESGVFYPAPSVQNCRGCPFRAPCRAWRG